MKSGYIVVGLVLIAFTFTTCKKGGNTRPVTIGYAAAAHYASYIAPDDARKYLGVLSSDDFEGRETGTPGAEKTAAYIAGEFGKLGLQAPVDGSYFFDVPLQENEYVVNSFTVNGTSYKNGKDFYANEAVPAGTINAADIVFIGYGISDINYDDFNGLDITGKVVLCVNDGEPVKDGISKITGTAARSQWSTDPAFRIQRIRARKPALILAVNPYVLPALNKFGADVSGNRLYIKNKVVAPGVKAPVFNISVEIADKLLAATGKSYSVLKKGIDDSGTPDTRTVSVTLGASYTTRVKDIKAVDVLGYMPGTDLKDEVVVVSAHYDHLGINLFGADQVFNGADDDGSGTTGILEIARAFAQAKKEGHGPRRSILFLSNVGEEKGLLGSEYYTDHPVFPLANTVVDLNIDMIGRTGFDYDGNADAQNYVFVIGSAMLSNELHDIGENANNTHTQLKLDYRYDDPNDPNRFYYRSDHYNFARYRVPIIFYFDGLHADYHQVSDEIAKIDFPLLVKRAQLVFYTAWDLANRDKRPKLN